MKLHEYDYDFISTIQCVMAVSVKTVSFFSLFPEESIFLLWTVAEIETCEVNEHSWGTA